MTGSTRSRQPGLFAPSARSQRLAYIASEVSAAGYISTLKLAELLDVSKMTVHRDLHELQAAGVLQKVRGGASASMRADAPAEAAEAALTAEAHKRMIGAQAATLVAGGQSIILDNSTSASEMVAHLRQVDDLTVITNSVATVLRAQDLSNVELLALGGRHDPELGGFYGPLAESALNQLFASTVFMSASALRDGELYATQEASAALKRVMLQAASRRVLLLDSSKVRAVALYHVCHVDQFTDLVTDSQLPPALLSEIATVGVNTHVAR